MLSKADAVPKKLGTARTDVLDIGYVFAGTGAPADTLDTVETDESELDTIQAAFSPSLTRRMRPCPGGFSVGHFRVTAGTLATCCYDLAPFPSKS